MVSPTIRFTSKSQPDSDEWLNPIAMCELQRAVKAKKKEVILNGIKYRIGYGFSWTSVLDGTHEMIQLKRVDGGYAPFGYVGVKRILEYDFESDD